MTVAARLATGARDAARVTNLGIAAAAAHRLGLLPIGMRPCSEGVALRDAVHALALSALPNLSHERSSWAALARQVNRVADGLNRQAALDTWVEVWQASDPARKMRGAYATPAAFAAELATATLGPLAGARRGIRVVDPSAGAGALLVATYRVLSRGKTAAGRRSVLNGLHGMELDPSTRELCCLVLWLEAGSSRTDLASVARNVVVGDAVTHDWWARDGGSPGFDALVMNPPWESLRHAIAKNDPHAARRRATVARLSRQEAGAGGLPPLFSAQGRGDRNLFKAFMELAPHLLREGGRYGALVPAAFGSDLGMAPLRERYFGQLAMESWTVFENLRRYFLIDGRYKFGLLIGVRSDLGTKTVRVRSFATEPQEIHARHATVAIEELPRLGGPLRMLPELTDQEEKDTLVQALSYGTQFFRPSCIGQVSYKRELDLTLGLRKGAFDRFENHRKLFVAGCGLFCGQDGKFFVPVMEGRMVGQYDIFQKSWADGRGRTARWEINGPRPLASCRPQFVTAPRSGHDRTRLAICDVTSATNTRTVHATWVPDVWRCGNTAPVLEFDTAAQALVGLGILNSMVFDWLTRRIVGGLHLNKFYLAALAWPRLSEEDMSRIAPAAAALCNRNARFAAADGHQFLADAGIKHLKKAEAVDALATIETLVARGFGLNARMLTRIFSPARNDRRGLWRYFESEPLALGVAARALAASQKPRAYKAYAG